ncbi:MAG TPA: AAA family ATPase [Candidatus Limnocylindria bacterium]|nr:AAA family ATPase [Candidatus Limnocylindria bacterium]
MIVSVPADAMIVLVGAAGSGKSTLAARLFAPTEVLSSDAFRAIVAEDETDQSASVDAFALLHAALTARLKRGHLTVVDATNVEEWGRRQLLEIAARWHRPAVALVLDLPLEVCLTRNLARSGRRVPPAAVRRQHRELRASLHDLAGEGFAAVDLVTDPEEIDDLQVVRDPQSSVVVQRATSRT